MAAPVTLVISSAQQSVTPSTVAGTSVLGGAIYNANSPVPTDGQGLALQADSAGALVVTMRANDAAMTMQTMLLAEAQALRTMLALQSPGFQIVPDGPSFWLQQG